MTAKRAQHVIVTGGAGFVGAHACKALALAGFVPVAVDNLARGFSELVRFGPLEQGDIRDREFLTRVFTRYAPVGVMHFAALAYVHESVVDPALYWDNNVGGSLSLLEVMRQFAAPPLVFSSTCAVYGTPHTQDGVDENQTARPESPYGESKWMVERILASYRTAYQQRSVCLRYFNVAGSDPDGEIGELHDPEPHVIPRLLRTALGLENEFVINGDDWPTADGSCIRDYIHVSDLANAHVLALQKMLAGVELPTAINLGNEHGVSVKQLVQAVEKVTGVRLPVRVGQRRAGDPARVFANARLARSSLDWQCEHTDLTASVLHAWNWIKSRHDASAAATAK
jgi:UDP-glucose-4-epimerase GalE